MQNPKTNNLFKIAHCYFHATIITKQIFIIKAFIALQILQTLAVVLTHGNAGYKWLNLYQLRLTTVI
jgi:hypothetical protein